MITNSIIAKRIMILSFLFVLVHPALWSQDHWINYTSGKSIQALADDGNFLWVGTLGGLVKVDKVSGEATFYDKTNSGLPDNRVNAVVANHHGIVWVGTEFGGLAKFDGNEWVIYNTENSGINGNSIQDIAIDKAGEIWICSNSREIEGGSYGSRIIEFNGINWTVHNPTVYSYMAKCIAVDDDNNKWVGTTSGLFKYTGTDWTIWDTDNSPMPVDYITCITIDLNKKIVMGFDHAGFGIFNGVNEWNLINEYNSSLPNNIVISLAIDKDNAIWIGMNLEGGLVKYNGTTWWYWNPAFYTMPGYGPHDIVIDDNNIAWIGLFAEGLYSLTGDEWTYYNTSISGLDIYDNEVYAIAIDSNQNKWIGYGLFGGFSMFNGNVWTNYTTLNSEIAGGTVYAIETDKHDNKWIGSYRGLTMLNDEECTVFDVSNSGLPVSWVNAIAIDEFDHKWIGTNGGGLAEYNDNAWIIYDKYNSGLTDSIVTTIYIDEDGNKWVGTKYRGLFKFDGDTWTNYDTINSNIPTNNVTSIKMDAIGKLWIGTSKYYGIPGGNSFKGGLSRFDGTTWMNFTKNEHGFPSDGAFDIAIDRDGNKWVATSNGLVKHDGTTATVYDILNSGMPSYRVYCIEIDSSENIWIGTENGLALFNYNKENNDLFYITVQGTDATCDNASDGSATVTNYYGTPNYSYAWNDPGLQTTKIASNLSPGPYSVNVVDSHGDTASATIIISHTNVQPVITEIDGSLFSSKGSGNQWYLDNNILNGDTMQKCIPIGNGAYVVIVTDSNDCQTSSEPYNYSGFGLHEYEGGDHFRIRPNPNDGRFVIECKNVSIPQELRLEIYNPLGMPVYIDHIYIPGSEIDLSKMPEGIYFVKLFSGESEYSGKLIIR